LAGYFVSNLDNNVQL